jgi:RNA polymerase sigma factor (sigma-70 family)
MIPSSPSSPAILRQIRAAVAGQLSAVPDAELIARFLRTRDETAFELLVWRHGQLVWGVCRRTARDRHAVEDAFQATFLALARRAGSVANRAALAGWLYRVAYRAAREAARRARGRTEPLADAETVPDRSTSPADEAARRELRRVIDEEVYRLPERFRDVFVLCELQGRTATEAAAALGCPVGTVESRLTRARVRLRKRLTLRGVTAAGGVAGLSVAGAPGELLAAGVRAGVDGPGAVSAQVAALATRAAGAVGWTLPLSGALAVVAGLVTVVGLSAAPPAANAPPSVAVKPADEMPLPAGVVARLGSTRFRGPPCQIEHAAFSPDGKSLAVAGFEALRVFDTATGTTRFTHSTPWSVPRFTRAGRLVALYRNKSGLVLRRFAADGRFSEKVVCPPPKEFGADMDVFALSADATRLAVLRGDTKVTLRVYDTATGRVKCTVPLGDIRKATMWRGPVLSADGSRVALVVDRIARVIATDTGAELDRWILPDAPNAIGFSDDGQLAATSFEDPEGGNVVTYLRDVTTRTTVQLAEPINQIIGYTFDRSGTLLATRDYHGVTVWDLKQKKIRHRLARGMEVSVAEFSPDSKWLMTANNSGAISLWDTATGKRLPVSADPPDAVTKLRFLSGGQYVAGYSGGWRTWDSKTGRPGPRLGATPNWSWPWGDLYPDGRLTATIEPQSLVLTDGRTGRVRTIEPIPGGAHGVHFSADGRKLVLTQSHDIVVWNLAPWRKGSTVTVVGKEPRLHTVSPDGKLALLSFGGAIDDPPEKRGYEAYDLTTGKPLWRDADPKMYGWPASTMSADGRLVAYNRPRRSRSGYPAADGGLAVREFATGRLLLTVNDEEQPPGDELALSPDGRLLAEGYYFKEGLIRLRDVKTGKVLRTLRHKAGITSLAFSPDGKTLAAASNDAPVYLWDVSDVRPGD